MSEHKIQCELIKLVNLVLSKYPELKWLHSIPNGSLRKKIVAIKLKREGTKPGVFDLFLPVKRGVYSGYYIEIKFGKNKLSKEQKLFQKFVKRQGFKTDVFYDHIEAFNSIVNYLNQE